MKNKLIRKDEVLLLLQSIGGCDATEEWSKGFDAAIDEAYKAVENMRTVNAINLGSYEITEDCISREEAINRIEAIEPISTISDYQRGIAVGFALAKISIQEQRSVQQKTGHWVDMMVGDMPAQACDLCKTFFSMAHTGGGHHYCPNYCPNCGAKMEGGGE